MAAHDLTLFFLVFPFDPPENIRKPMVFWCFQGDQKGTFGRKSLTLLFLLVIYRTELILRTLFMVLWNVWGFWKKFSATWLCCFYIGLKCHKDQLEEIKMAISIFFIDIASSRSCQYRTWASVFRKYWNSCWW